MPSITTYDITNNQGDTITIANFGARLIKWQTSVDSECRDVIIGYDKINDYLEDPFYLGAIAGPYANRVANAKCTIDGKSINLSANEGNNQLHGGDKGLSEQLWQCVNRTKSTITLSCTLEDGFNGYPGDITTTVQYFISKASELIISIMVSTDKTTIAGPTSHPYFNLNADNSTQHTLQVNAEHYTPVNSKGIPLDEIKQVVHSSYDFRLAKDISSNDDALQLDDNFITSLTDTSIEQKMYHQATLKSKDEKLTLNVSSNYPAIQVYTGQHLQSPFKPKQGICLEPQFCPDSPNQSAFPFHLTLTDSPLETVICYELVK